MWQLHKNDPNYKRLLGYLKSVKGLSINTIQSYYYDLKSFLKFVAIRLEILDQNDEYYYTSVTVNDIKSFRLMTYMPLYPMQMKILIILTMVNIEKLQ
ncbi:site-specific integrase [Fenollaria sporofastidiosus]|uniref:site-specific integrase n=1 Tax=Fenollaria sporofastidiosus TaxID=2811778 RepID=UPI003BA98925